MRLSQRDPFTVSRNGVVRGTSRSGFMDKLAHGTALSARLAQADNNEPEIGLA